MMSTNLEIPLMRALLIFTVGSLTSNLSVIIGTMVFVDFDVDCACNEFLNIPRFHYQTIKLLASASCLR